MSSKASPDGSTVDTSTEQSPGAATVYTRRAVWLLGATLAAGVWWFALGTMAARTANPVTYNFEQVRQSTVVVKAEVLDTEPGRIRVEKCWPHDFVEVGTELTVSNLGDSPAKSGETYLFPLRTGRRRGDWSITEPRLPGQERNDRGEVVDRTGPPTLYPATDEAERQLEGVLDTLSRGQRG